MDQPVQTRPAARVSELTLYYALVGLYFFAFGMQWVLYPSLAAFVLEASPTGVGLAQSALSAPMFCFLLFGGLLAERAKPGLRLAQLHLLFALASIALAAIVAAGRLNYPILIGYAVFVGSCAAFAMPIRDAALNGVLEREAAKGRLTPIATAAAMATAVQIGAQIAGILVARLAGATPAPYLALQAVALTLTAAVSLTLRAPKPHGERHTIATALRDLRDGLVYSFKNPVMSPMLVSAAYMGVFVIGAFQVLFPLIVRDSYGGSEAQQAGRLGVLLAAFWGACFVSAVALSRAKPLRRPGRALVASHLIGAAALFAFALETPFSWFLGIVVTWGLVAGVAISTSRTIVQGAASPAFLGRVLAVYSMGFMGGAPLGSAVTGYAAHEWGARAAALLPAAGLAIAALALALTTPLWRYNDTAAQ